MAQGEISKALAHGIQALQDGDLEIAENIFQNILLEDPYEIHSLHFLGVLFCQKGNLNEGIALIEKSISLDDSRIGPSLNLCRFLIVNDQCSRAISILQDVVQRDIFSGDAWSLLAKAYYSSASYEAAISAGLGPQIFTTKRRAIFRFRYLFFKN